MTDRIYKINRIAGRFSNPVNPVKLILTKGKGRSGEWGDEVMREWGIFPRDVEETIFEIPGVRDTAVTVQNGQFTARIVKQAPDQPPTAADILTFCRKHLPHADIPLQVEFVDGLDYGRLEKTIRFQR